MKAVHLPPQLNLGETYRKETVFTEVPHGWEKGKGQAEKRGITSGYGQVLMADLPEKGKGTVKFVGPLTRNRSYTKIDR